MTTVTTSLKNICKSFTSCGKEAGKMTRRCATARAASSPTLPKCIGSIMRATITGWMPLISGWTGVDFSTYDLDQQVRHVQNDAGRTAMDNITRADPDRVWTVREVAEHVGIGGIGPVVVGTPEKVADEIEAWFEQTDVDGLNVPFAISPGDFEDITDMLVPELTRRGRYKQGYRSRCSNNDF